MRRLIVFLCCILLLMGLTLGASAATGARQIGAFATVSSDGSCQVNMTVTLHLEQGLDELRFPIPAGATDVSVNGSRTWVGRSGGTRYVDLSRMTRGMAGEFTFTIHFALSNVVHRLENTASKDTDEKLLELQLPLLSGFAYPVSQFSFSVTIPGSFMDTPVFSSGYYKEEIEKSMTYTVEGATVSGTIQEELKDHETLTMTLSVSEAMFPQTAVEIRDLDFVNTAMGIFAGAAALYWLLFLRVPPFLRKYCPEPPEGRTAGELGCVINSRGLDLTMTVFSWAQLGYILIQIDRNDRVILHKRMEMGNERDQAERIWFQRLFGKKKRVDTGSVHYAQLCGMAERGPVGVREVIHSKSGNPRVFRALVSGIGIFGGLALGSALGNGGALQDLMIVILAVFGAVTAWVIQGWAYALVFRERFRLWLTLGCALLWMVLGAAGSIFNTALWVVLGLLFGGLLLCFGGRRTKWGRILCGQILGLRHYLRTVNQGELQRICRSNPDYFFSLAPCALAFGVEKSFARRFGSKKLPGCPWLTTGMDAHMDALEWAELMNWTVSVMDARRRQMPLEKLLRLIGSFRRTN